MIPYRYRAAVLKEIHEAHMGIVKMKALARSYVWWPCIDKDIELLAKQCKTCAKFSDLSPKTPLTVWNWPKDVWTRLHADFFGPCCGSNFFVIEDATSKWIECFEVKNMTSCTTIKIFRGLFARYGLPKQICTDNAATFTSDEFQTFLHKNGVKHVTGAPFHPETNGQAESAVKILKKAILKGYGEGNKDLNLIINRFLFQYRNTPHTTTGEKPSKLLIGRSLPSRFDLMLPSVKNVVKSNQERQKTNYGGKVKKQFNVNDTVWVKDYRPNTDKWSEGIIKKVLGKNTFLITMCNGGMVWKRHSNQLKLRANIVSEKISIRDQTIHPIAGDDKCTQPNSFVHVNNENVSETENSQIENKTSQSEISNTTSNVSERVLRRRSRLKPPERFSVS